MSQITLRQIPDILDKQLRSLADKNKTSLNKIIISLLLNNLGIKEKTDKKRDLSKLSGTWSEMDYRDFQKNTEIFDTIDSEIWE